MTSERTPIDTEKILTAQGLSDNEKAALKNFKNYMKGYSDKSTDGARRAANRLGVPQRVLLAYLNGQ